MKPMDVLVTHSWWATIVIDSSGNMKTLEEGATASGFVSTGCFKKDEGSMSPNLCAVTWKNELFLYGNQRISHLTGYKLSVLSNKLNFGYYRGEWNDGMEKKCGRASDPTGHFTEVASQQKYHQDIPITASESK